MAAACPTPNKIKHRTAEAAEKQLASMRAKLLVSPDLVVYPCGGHWHVGHSQRSLEKRIRRALRNRGEVT